MSSIDNPFVFLKTLYIRYSMLIIHKATTRMDAEMSQNAMSNELESIKAELEE